MAFQLSPSVDVREIDLTNIVPAVSTSIGGLAGSFEWGPCEQVVTIADEKTLRSLYGDPRIITSVSSFSNQNDWYSAANFLSYASNLKIVRGVSDEHRNSSEYKTLVGEYRTKASFIPASLSTTTYTVDFGNATVIGTSPEGDFQKLDILFTALTNSGLSNSIATSGERKRYKWELNSPGSFVATSTVQEEKISFSGVSSSNGTIVLSFGDQTEIVNITSGSSSSAIATSVANAINSSAPAVGSAIASTNTVTLTRNFTGSSVSLGTGIDVSTGKARSVGVDVTNAPGLTSTVSVETVGLDENTYAVEIFSDPESYLLVSSGETSTQIAFNAKRAIEGLTFSLKGNSEDPISNVGSSVEWTNTLFGASPDKDITSVDLTGAPSGLSVTISTVRPGSDPTPSEDYNLVIDGTGNGDILKVLIKGGSSMSKIASQVKDAINANGLQYSVNQNWLASVPSENTSSVRLTAPAKSSTSVTPVISYEDSNEDASTSVSAGFDGSLTNQVSGTPVNSTVLEVNGVNFVAQEGDSSADLAAEWKDTVENTVYEVSFSNVVASSVNGSGSGATFTVERSGTNYSLILTNGGDDYVVGDVIRILGSSLGGNDGAAPTGNDVEITVLAVGIGGTITNVSATGGSGLGALFNVSVSGGSYQISVPGGTTGQDYLIGDSLTIPSTSISPSAPSDITFDVATVNSLRTYENVASTGGTGSSATFNVTRNGTSYTLVNIANGGDDYTVGDSITVDGANLGGTTTINDATFNVAAVDDGGTFSVTDESGLGSTDAQISVTKSGGTYTSTSVEDGGDGYSVGDTLTVSGSLLNGADVTNDFSVDVLTVNNIEVYGTAGSPLVDPGAGSASFIVRRNGGSYSIDQVVATGGTLDYAVSDTIVLPGTIFDGVSPANDATVTVTAVNNNEDYASVSGTGSAGSNGAIFNVNRNGGTYTITSIANAGTDYSTGETITVSSGDLDGSNDLVFDIDDVNDETVHTISSDDLSYTGTGSWNLGQDVLSVTTKNGAITRIDVLIPADTSFADTEVITFEIADLPWTAGYTNTPTDVTLTLDATSAPLFDLAATEISLANITVGGTLPRYAAAIETVTITSDTASANGSIDGISGVSIGGVAVETGPILTLDAGTITGTASTTGVITSVDTLAGVAVERGPVTSVTNIVGTPISIGPIAGQEGVGFSSSGVSEDGLPVSITNNNDGTLTVVTDGNEVIAPMVGTQSNPSEDLVLFGVPVKTSPVVSSPSSYDTPDHQDFVAEGDITSWLNAQLGDQSNPSFTPTSVTIGGSPEATGLATEWSYDSGSDQTTIKVLHDQGITYSVGLPVLEGNEVSEPEGVDGVKAYVKTNELIKNDEQFEIVKTSLDGGNFYAIYPGAKGNSIGVGLVDACSSEEAYESSLFGDGNQFKDFFDGRPGTSDYSLSINSGTNDELHVVVFDRDGKLTGTKGSILEAYPFLSKNKIARTPQGGTNYYVEVINDNSDYIRVTEGFVGAAGVRVDLSQDLEWGDEATAEANESFGVMNFGVSFDLKGGSDAELTDGELIQAYDLLSDAESVDISLLLSSNHSKTVKKHIVSIVDTRRDAVAFISPDYDSAVASSDTQKIVDYFNNSTDGFVSSSYAVFDSGFKYQYDRYNNVYFWSPLSSDVAGLCARTDETNDPWWSPAGISRGQIKNVARLSYNPSRKTDRDELYKNRINPVVTFTGEGTLLYGDKTAQSKPSAFDRINVRRLFIVLEKAISTAARSYLFEFNDAFTRASFVSTIEPFLRDVRAKRGVEDFRVVCDETNNTAQVINSNSFVGDIYIKPNRSINFITLNFVAVSSGVEFEEVVNPTGN